eukprot:jgi/Astpho2/8941/Aster-02621
MQVLHETQAKERSIEEELEKLLQQREQLEGMLLQLHSSTREVLEVVKADAEGLAESVQGTSALSERVSRKVRELDSAQSNIHEAMQRIGVIVDRTNAVDGVQRAMQAEDYEAAAGFVERFLRSEAELAQGQADPEATQNQTQQQKARQKLQKVAKEGMAAAIVQQDHAGVLRFSALFLPLGYQGEGLELFVAYLRRLVGERAKEDYSALVENTGHASGDSDYISTLTKLFKDIATAVQDNQQWVVDTFGREALLQTVLGLQEECDIQGSRLVQRYIEDRKLERLVHEIGAAGAASRGDTPSGHMPVDPREVEGHLEEMLELCKRSEQYSHFMLGAAGEAGDPLDPAAENRFRSGRFNVIVRELIAYYVNMEEFYLEQSIDKAIAIDEWAGETVTTSMVDDVFYILRLCGHRALDTGNLPCVCAVLGQLNTLLSQNYRTALEGQWKVGTGELPGNAAPTDPAQHAAILNNPDMSAMYVHKLRKELEDAASWLFRSPNDRERVRSVLDDLSKTAGDFAAISRRALDHLCNGLLPKLRPVLDEVSSVSYELSDAQFEARAVEDTWVNTLLTLLALYLHWLQPLLTKSNFEHVVGLLLEKIVDRLEAITRLKTFNLLGGLQIERDVRQLINAASEITQMPVRDRFAKLSQMSTMLAIENVAEMQDFWGANSDSISWRFNQLQVREVLRQRSDLDRSEISRLELTR